MPHHDRCIGLRLRVLLQEEEAEELDNDIDHTQKGTVHGHKPAGQGKGEQRDGTKRGDRN
jgi:hypothetical protein